MKEIVILGSGGCGREVLQIILDMNEISNEWDFKGFLVETEFFRESVIHCYPVLKGLSWLEKNHDVEVVVAVGSSAKRMQIVNRLRAIGHQKFPTLVHPKAWLGRGISIGNGSIICSGALITTDIVIGDHVQVGVGATIGHDVCLEDFASINPNVSISGGVVLKRGAEVGAGSVIIPKRVIGSWSILGAGSVVTKDIAENSTAVGSPAKMIKVREEGWELRV